MAQSFESWYKTTLALEMQPSDVTMAVATAPTVTVGRVFLDNGAQQERIGFTWVSGSTLTGLSRWLSKTSDPATVGTGLTWMAGTTVRIVAMHDQLVDKAYDQTISSNWTFSGTNAWLNLTWSRKGMTMPQLTSAQRIALTPVNGMVVYDTDQGKLYQYANSVRWPVWSGWWWSGWWWSKTSKSNNTVYQAWPNGWMVVASYFGATPIDLVIYSDWSNPPTTVVAKFTDTHAAYDDSTTVPILPNMYYKVTWASNVDYYEIGSWSWGNTIFISEAIATLTDWTITTTTHNLNVTQSHIESGRYKFMVSFNYNNNWHYDEVCYAWTWQNYNQWTPNNPWSSAIITRQANTLKFIANTSGTTFTNVRVHIIDTWITSAPWTFNTTTDMYKIFLYS